MNPSTLPVESLNRCSVASKAPASPPIQRFNSLTIQRLACLASLLALTACSTTRPLKPGTARITSTAPTTGTHFASELKQPENPAQSAAQQFERTTETELPLPAGSTVQETVITPPAPGSPAPPVRKEKIITLKEPTVQVTRVIEKAGTSIGAAQKDTARELGAKLASLKPVIWAGLTMFAFGLASLFYPPLRAIIGSLTTSMAITAGGLLLIILPNLIVGHELLLLGAVLLAVGGWFLAHRHGWLRAQHDSNQQTTN